MGPALGADVILTSLRELNASVSVPLWLFGGVAVDFMVGRWTRAHSDIDLNTFTDTRDALAVELGRIGYRTADSGWLTHWSQESTSRRLEIVFLDQCADGAAELRIPEHAPVGIPGRYPLLPGYMDPARFAKLGDVSFRVCSPAGEWLSRAKSVVAGRVPEPKIEHDRILLEAMIPPGELGRLRLLAQRH